MKSKSKIYFILYLFLLILGSCKKNNIEYEILTDFIQSNRIEITDLQNDPFCFKNLYLSKLEEKALNISLQNDVFCNNKIETDRLHAVTFQKNELKSQISFPVYSNDGKYVYIIVSHFNNNEGNSFRSTILYKLRKIKNHWKIIDEYKTITQT